MELIYKLLNIIKSILRIGYYTKVYYDVNGGVIGESEFFNGVLHGKSFVYNKHGRLSTYSNYWYGVLHGLKYSYHNNNIQISNYRYNSLHGFQKFYRNKNLFFEELWLNGTNQNFERLYNINNELRCVLDKSNTDYTLCYFYINNKLDNYGKLDKNNIPFGVWVFIDE